SWTFPMGNAKLAGIAAEDIGKTAYGIFKAGDRYIGKTVGIAGEHLTLNQISEKLAKGLGIGAVKYKAVELNDYGAFGFQAAEEIRRESGVLALGIPADVKSIKSVKAAAADVVSQLRTIHILVNNAGGPIRRVDRQIEWPDSDWIDDINMKIVGMLRCVQAF